LQSTANAPQANEPGGDLVANIRVWYTLQRQIAQLKSAREAALAANASISKTHDELEQTARAKGLRSNNTADPASASNPSAPATAGTEQSRGALLASLQSLSQDQKNLASLDQRIQDTQDLAEILSDWTGLVQTRQMVAFRGVIRSALWILMIVLLFYIGARVVERYIPDVRSERSRMHTMRTIVKVAVQSIGVLLILFVIFGAPTQLSTVLALAGAGLTVALKDFIVAFLGWFVLMGRNGIRIGDWVEIHGVVGEVVEINLLRTLLLETGNWKEPGHPTGRKVAFMNGYAIEGHFFNFSTSGQWLWDELQISIPSNENLHAVLEAIQQLVVKETAPNAKLAEQEWQRAAGRYKVMQSVSATPAVQVRPTPNGVQVNVRYISRANESYALRARLYQSVVDLLHDSSLSRTEPEAVQSVE
jgi:small-conductance mechanosensitive channel